MNGSAKERIGDYELIELIGDGAQGKVFKARCIAEKNPRVALDEIVAMKVLRFAGDDEKAVTRFQSQAEILQTLSHLNIVRYRDSFIWHQGEWDEAKCLVMEFLEGDTLTDRLKKTSGGMPWPEAKNIFEQCLAGLIFARDRAIIHRDIKPSNIFITKSGAVKIFDFDIARRETDSQASTAGWKGTFDYMAPDFVTETNFRGDEVSDIFSLGVCFYQALTGKLPFEPLGEDAHIGYLNRWRNPEGKVELSYRPGVFRVLAHAKMLISKCLQPDRTQRYKTFNEMLEDFQKVHYRRIQHKGKEEYELVAVLGRGGFGEVFQGRRVRDGLTIAIKHLFSEKQSSRFVKEAKILQRYEHQHIVKYLDFLVVEGAAKEEQYFLIMEYLEGMPGWCLRNRIKNEGKLELTEALPLFSNYLKALEFLHENSRPIVHRDIKPTNLYAPAGQPHKARIFDMGVARDVSGTVTYGGVPGTLDYMAPEFAKAGSDRGSPQSDLYALGLCFYEAIAGHPAYDKLPSDINTAWIEFQRRSQTVEPVSFDAMVFRQCPRLKTIIEKAIDPNPKHRYESAAKMRVDIDKLFEDLPQQLMATPAEEEPLTMATISTKPGGLPVAAGAEQKPAGPERSTRRSSSHGRSSLEENVPEWDIPDEEEDATSATRMADARGDWASWASKYKSKKRLFIALGAAAALLVVILLGSRTFTGIPQRLAVREMTAMMAELQEPVPTAEYVDKVVNALAKANEYRKDHPKLAGQWQKDIGTIQSCGRMLPDKFKESFATAIIQKNGTDAFRLYNDWQKLQDNLTLFNLTAPQFAERTESMKFMVSKLQFEQSIADLNQKVPARIAGDDDLARAEEAAKGYQDLNDKDHPGISNAEKQRQLKAIRTKLNDAASARITDLQNEALKKFGSDQDGDSVREELLMMASKAPVLVSLVQPVYEPAAKNVEAAWKTSRQARDSEKMLAAIQAATTPEELSAIGQDFGSWESNTQHPPTPDQVKKVEKSLISKYSDLAGVFYKQARAEYEALRIQEGMEPHKALQNLLNATPERFGRNDLQKLDNDLAVLREKAESKLSAAETLKQQQTVEDKSGEVAAREQEKAAIQQKTIADTQTLLAGLRKKASEGDRQQWKEAIKALAGISPEILAYNSVKTQWDSTVAEYIRLIQDALTKKDPLSDRNDRLRQLDEILSPADAEKALGNQTSALREQLARQKALFILRVINESGQPVTVNSANIIKDTKMAPGNRLDFSLSVKKEGTEIEVLLQGPEGTQPRKENVKLTGGSAREIKVVALASEHPTPDQKAQQPEPKAGEETKAAPTAGAADTSAKTGILLISVVPKNATILLDGEQIEAGELQVSSDINHKLKVEAPGFITFEQYYRVNTGKTKRVEILLEKKKASFFF